MGRCHILVSATLAVGLGGCAKHHAPEALPTTAARLSVPTAPTETSALTNGQMVDVLLRVHTSEIAKGRLAAARTNDVQVRRFANRMVRDHSAARRDVEALASRRGIESESSRFSERIDAARRDEIAELQRRSGSDLDREYMEHETQKLRSLVSMIDRELVPRTGDREIYRTLTKTRRLLEAGLDDARRVEAMLPR